MTNDDSQPPESKAARIRRAINDNPGLPNKAIAALLDLPGRAGLVDVAIERRRMRLRAERDAAGATD